LEKSGTYITKFLTVTPLTAKPKPARGFTIKSAETLDSTGFYGYLNPESLTSYITQPLQKDKNLVT
jgi:hypothetical protein